MSVRVFAIAALSAILISFAGISCRREPVESSSGKTGPAAAVQPKTADTNLLAAIAARHQAERAWRASKPEAQAAFKRMTDTEAAYAAAVGQFGLYAVPAAERDAAMATLAEAREKGDTARAEAAEKAVQSAGARAEEAAARLRSGNPSIQKAYDAWVAARQDYAEMCNREETISKAAATMTQLMEKKTRLENDRNDRPKEN